MGDLSKIGGDVMCMIINLCELLIVKCVVEVIEYFGYFYDGFLM